jgi:nitrogen PTS system EIIA component
MLLSELLTQSRVVVDSSDRHTKKSALGVLAETLAHSGSVSSSEIEKVLVERESVQSTGVGDGVAIPHGALPDLASQHAALLILANGIDFEAIDHHKVKILFAVIGPKHASGEHLKTLAKISRLLRALPGKAYGRARRRARVSTYHC